MATGDDRQDGSGLPNADSSLTVRTGWVRDRLWVSELDRLLSNPAGADLSGIFEPLRVRTARAIERIHECARQTNEAIRQRARILKIMGATSAAIGIGALVIALTVRAYAPAAGLIALAEMAVVVVCRLSQRRLSRDLLAAAGLESLFQEDLEAAKTPEDLHRLADRIRSEMGRILGLAV